MTNNVIKVIKTDIKEDKGSKRNVKLSSNKLRCNQLNSYRKVILSIYTFLSITNDSSKAIAMEIMDKELAIRLPKNLAKIANRNPTKGILTIVMIFCEKTKKQQLKIFFKINVFLIYVNFLYLNTLNNIIFCGYGFLYKIFIRNR